MQYKSEPFKLPTISGLSLHGLATIYYDVSKLLTEISFLDGSADEPQSVIHVQLESTRIWLLRAITDIEFDEVEIALPVPNMTIHEVCSLVERFLAKNAPGSAPWIAIMRIASEFDRSQHWGIALVLYDCGHYEELSHLVDGT